MVWFGRYSLLFFVPLFILFFAFLDREDWFLGLSTWLALTVAFFAWRAANANIRLRWRLGLAVVMLTGWGFLLLAAYASPGDTRICYDRLSRPIFRGPVVNRGPDPACDGIAIQNIDLE